MGIFDPKPLPAPTSYSVDAREADERAEKARADGEANGRRLATAAAEERIARLVMRAYDLADKYPDTEEEHEGQRPLYMWSLTETYTYTVKTPGWGRLIADLEAIANAQDVESAAARLGVKR